MVSRALTKRTNEKSRIYLLYSLSESGDYITLLYFTLLYFTYYLLALTKNPRDTRRDLGARLRERDTA